MAIGIIGIFDIKAKIETDAKHGVIFATYQCPDKHCKEWHVVGTISSEFYEFPAIKAAWEKLIEDAIGALAKSIIEDHGGKIVGESVTKQADMN